MRFSYTVAIGSQRAFVAAHLAQSFNATQPNEVDDVRALQKTAAATIERAVPTLNRAAITACRDIARTVRVGAYEVQGEARVAVLAAVIRELLADAPEMYCALDKRVRDACERRFPLAEEHRELVARIVARTVRHVEGV